MGESDAGGGAVQVVDRTRSGALLAAFDNAEVVGWRWTPGSDLILVIVTDDTGGIIPSPTDWAVVEVSRSDLLAGGQIPITVLQTFGAADGEPTVLDVSPDGEEFLLSVADTLHVMDRKPNTRPHQLTSGGPPTRTVCSRATDARSPSWTSPRPRRPTAGSDRHTSSPTTDTSRS